MELVVAGGKAVKDFAGTYRHTQMVHVATDADRYVVPLWHLGCLGGIRVLAVPPASAALIYLQFCKYIVAFSQGHG